MIVAVPAIDRVVAGAADDGIVAIAAGDRVVAETAVDRVVAASAIERVVAPGIGEDDLVEHRANGAAGNEFDLVAATRTGDGIGIAGPGVRLTAGGDRVDLDAVVEDVDQLAARAPVAQVELQYIGFAGRRVDVLPHIRREAGTQPGRLVVRVAVRDQIVVEQGDGAAGGLPAGRTRAGCDEGARTVAPDGVILEAAIDEQVRGAAIGDQVDEIAVAGDRIVAVAASDHVVAEAAGQDIGVAVAGQRVVIDAAGHAFDVGDRVAGRIAAAGTIGREVDRHRRRGTGIGDDVVPRAAVHHVGARPADQRVVARATRQRIVASTAVENVVAAIAGQRVGIIGAAQVLDLRQRVGDEAGAFQPVALRRELRRLGRGQRGTEHREVVDLAVDDRVGAAIVVADPVVVPHHVGGQHHVAGRRADKIAVDVQLQHAGAIGGGDAVGIARQDRVRRGGDTGGAGGGGGRARHVAAHLEIERAVGANGQEGEVIVAAGAGARVAQEPDSLVSGRAGIKMHRRGHGEGIGRAGDIADRCVIARSVAVEIERGAMPRLSSRPAGAAQ